MSGYPPTSIAFQCPHCGHHTEVQLEFAGQSGPCVNCSKAVTIPTLESLAPQARPKRLKKKMPIPLKVGLITGGVVAVLSLCAAGWFVSVPIIKAAREAAQTTECEENLLAIHNGIEGFYAAKGHYPPAVIRDENGKAMHSWRVLILPYMGPEEDALFKRYNMDEPWDSTQNKLLWDKIPAAYSCPVDDIKLDYETNYLAVVGDNTVINLDEPTKRDGSATLTDRRTETMVVIEAKTCGVKWTEPRDILIGSLRAGLNSNNPVGPSSDHPHGVSTLMADGSVLRLPPETTPEDLRGMATIDGDEYVEILDTLLYDE